MMGDAAVGKSSLIRRFVFNEFDEKYITTIGTNVSKKDIKVVLKDQNNKLQRLDLTYAIWDIIGQREMHSFNLNYFRNANGGLVICDITRRETMENLELWASSFQNITGTVPLVFIVNKFDLRNNASFEIEEIESIAVKYNAPYLVTSARTGENVESAFYQLGELILKKKKAKESGSGDEVSKVASEIIMEFSNYVGGIERGIPLIKDVFKASGVDFTHPKKEQLLNALPELLELLRDLEGNKVAENAEIQFHGIIAKLC
jgi:small GTP-binding protein